MKAINQIHSIRFADIDIANNSFSLSLWEESPSNTLLDSIRTFGILHPPILLENKGKYIIVAGKKRIIAAKHCFPTKNISCHVLPAETGHKTICAYILEENLIGRLPTVVEQIKFFELFLQTSSVNDALPLLEKLGHKPHEHVLHSILRLRSLADEVLFALNHEIISLKNAEQLLTLSTSDQKLIIRLITMLRLGGSKQRKLIELSKELLLRKNLSLEQIFTESPIPESEKIGANIPQQAATLLAWLHQQCFPRSTTAEDDYKKQVASLKLPSNMGACRSFPKADTQMSGVGKSGILRKEETGLHILGHSKLIHPCAVRAEQLPPPL